MIENSPKLKSISSLGTVGFYEFKRLSVCPFGGISARKLLEDGQLPDSIPNKQLIVGNVYHDLMDESKKVSSKQELIGIANKIFAKYENKYRKYIKQKKLGSIRSWSEIGRALGEALKDVGKTGVLGSNSIGILVSKNEKFKGVPDKCVITNSEVNIVEYKSASIFFDGGVKDEYLEQVKFYSYLVRDNFREIEKFRTKLLSLTGETYEVVFEPEDIDCYGLEIEKIYNVISENILDQKFNFETCINCAKRSVCDTFIAESKKHNIDWPVFVVSGTLNSIIDKDDFFEVQIGEDNIKVKKTLMPDSLCIDNEYTFYNLVKHDEKYSLSEYSGVYEHN